MFYPHWRSGTGKTAVLKELQERGLAVLNEPVRELLSQQLQIDGPALPSKNPKLFVQTMMERSIAQFESISENKRLAFFDRGIPDVVVYAVRFGVESASFETSARKYRYNRVAFILPPWKEIFVTDEVRRLSFEMSEAVHRLHCEIYRRLGYSLVEVAPGSPRMRADFVLQTAQSKRE